MDKYRGIGVFDSGLGGLTVASAITKILPNEKIYYFGDTANVPYGNKSEGQIVKYVLDIIEFLKAKEIKALVMACNTSSAVVLPRLNGNVKAPVLGVIEFASRMALDESANEVIGVVANPVTVGSGAYVRTIKGISMNGTIIHQQACPRWVPLIEAGIFDGEEVEKVVREDIEPLLERNIDTLILGCTHYPYFAPVIRRIAGDGLKIINPADSLAYQLKKILSDSQKLSDMENPEHEFYVSGNAEDFRINGSRFLGKEIKTVHKVTL
ncbi:MAG: glutamate racemase [Firmicutes bacterium]|nr:glutamate racemase [Bacillota bacterium]